MILENWQIKALEDHILDYQDWINHVETCGIFAKPEKIINDQIYFCFNKMVTEYGNIDESLTNDEKVNIIVSQEGYKNRYERDNYIAPITLEQYQELKIKEIKNKTNFKIISVYTDKDQRNIDRLGLNLETGNKYTEDEKMQMDLFIDDIRLQGSQKQTLIRETIDEKIIDSIVESF